MMMTNKKCPDCGKFMKLTDRLPQDDEFDEELAIECGFTDEQLEGDRFEPPLCQFVYVQDQWECGSCFTLEWHTEGPRYYYNYETNQYDAPKPLTPKEVAALARQAQEDAGQMRSAFPVEDGQVS